LEQCGTRSEIANLWEVKPRVMIGKQMSSYSPPTGPARARFSKWLKRQMSLPHQKLVDLALKARSDLGESIIVLRENDRKLLNLVSMVKNEYDEYEFYLRPEVEAWLFESNIPRLFHDSTPVAVWPEDPTNIYTMFWVCIFEFRTDAHLVHFKFRWL
jgi:hypothetical protein